MTRPYADDCVPTATIEEYLDRLEEVIECAPTMPFTGKCVLDRKELNGLITAMRDSLSSEGVMSSTRSFPQVRTGSFQAVSSDIKPYGKGQDTSFETPFETTAQQRSFNEPEEPQKEVMDAQAEVARILEAAKAEAAKIRSGADEYAENTLASVEQNALGAARSARKGLEVLQRRRGSGN
jgi:hypothetical protein